MTSSRLTKLSTEDEIGEVLNRVRGGELSRAILTQLLSERHSVYEGRSTFQMSRIRGYALASFKEVGLPDSAVNFVLDELQNGRNAYTVAAAARGLRGAKRPKADYVRFLIQAIENLRYHDDSLDLTEFKPAWPLKHPSSGKLEVFKTLRWLRGYAKAAIPELNVYLRMTHDFSPDIREGIRETIKTIETDDRDLDFSCCEIGGRERTPRTRSWSGSSNIRKIGDLEVQDERGKLQPLRQVTEQKPTVVAFFYTRCMNPNKCTLTINKLGYLQKALKEKGLLEKVNLLAFTYDPSFDTPERMRIFGENRGVQFDPSVHFLRTHPGEFAVLSDFFELGVNHVGSAVNQHRLELFLLNEEGSVEISYTRLQWDVEKVAGDLDTFVEQASKRNWFGVLAHSLQQVVVPLLLIFFPKCPACWAAYLSAFGITSIGSIPYSPWLVLPITFMMVFNLYLLYRKAGTRNGLIPFWCSLLGVMLVGAGYLHAGQTFFICGIVLIFGGAVLNSLSHRAWSRLSFLTTTFFRRMKDFIPIKQIAVEN